MLLENGVSGGLPVLYFSLWNRNHKFIKPTKPLFTLRETVKLAVKKQKENPSYSLCVQKCLHYTFCWKKLWNSQKKVHISQLFHLKRLSQELNIIQLKMCIKIIIIIMCFNVKGVFSKSSGNLIVALIFCFSS